MRGGDCEVVEVSRLLEACEIGCARVGDDGHVNFPLIDNDAYVMHFSRSSLPYTPRFEGKPQQ